VRDATVVMLADLFVRDFRCFTEAKVELHPDVTLLVGRNAQGKTSLIEAACVLLRLQSPRTINRTELVRFGAATCLIEATWHGRRLRYAQSATTRRLALDGTTCGKSADYLAASGVVVWMDHRDMNLLRGSAEHRRRFLDFAASQMFPDYLHALRGYERALRGRNYVLKRDAMISWKQADAFARVMDGFAQVVWQRRAELCAALQPEVTAAHAKLSDSVENVSIKLTRTSDEALSLFDALLTMRDEEARMRSTAFGPHRDDIRMQLNGLDATTFASEGQQRSFALSMKLAQAHVLEHACGSAPLMLMDDVFGELDAHRRRALLNCLPAGTQKIITTTNLDWADADRASGTVYRVEQGALSRIQG
jgi:DNA replication and repair protein RecF